MRAFNYKTVLLFLMISVFSPVIAQEKPAADQEREEELLRAIDEQKKAINEQKRQFEDQKEEQERISRDINRRIREYGYDMDIETDENGNNVRIYRRGDRSFNMPGQIYIPEIPDVPDVPLNVFHFGDNSERTSWEFSKSVKENTYKKEYSFDVEKNTKSVSLSVSGDCRAGEIRIRILTPQGKTFSDVLIDEFGNTNVRKSFNISENENQDKTGEWKFLIDSKDATGFFRISFQTY